MGFLWKRTVCELQWFVRSKSTFHSKHPEVLIGCAGWSIPKREKPHFADSGSHLERYARQFSVVEINSSFYRPHRTSTYVRWAASVPTDFRFAVKMPKTITHTARLENAGALIAEFLSEAGGLGEKLGCLLVQLPPSLSFESKVASRFFEDLRSATQSPIAFEPRHATWFESRVEKLYHKFKIARVAADPATISSAGEPGGWRGLTYHRLHGSPRMYYSDYSQEYLTKLAERLVHNESETPAWCIFDNTAAGFAMPNARKLVHIFHSTSCDPDFI